jgi:hypothetical protein
MELLPLAPGACGSVALSDASYAQIVCGEAGFPDGKSHINRARASSGFAK